MRALGVQINTLKNNKKSPKINTKNTEAEVINPTNPLTGIHPIS